MSGVAVRGPVEIAPNAALNSRPWPSTPVGNLHP
jgi:hypothetical protein